MNEVDSYIKEAEDLLNYASNEFKIAEMGHDEFCARQVCEKAYLSLLKMTNAFFLKKGLKAEEIPKTDRGRFYLIREYMAKEMANKFFALREKLHIFGFHEGYIYFDKINEDLEELRELFDEIRQL